MTGHRLSFFVLLVLYSLPKKWRGIDTSDSFEMIVRGCDKLGNPGVNLHSAWDTLEREGMLKGVWDDFDFDPLTLESRELKKILRQEAMYGFVRIGGTDSCYHLDELEREEMNNAAQHLNISDDLVDRIAKRLNEVLEEQEANYIRLPPTSK